MIAVLDLQQNLPSWRDGGDSNVVVLDAYRDPSATVLIAQRGYQWYWSTEQSGARANGHANTYEGAAAAAGDWLKGLVH